MQIPSVISFMKKHGERANNARITHGSGMLFARSFIYINYHDILWFQNSIPSVYTWNIRILSMEKWLYIITIFSRWASRWLFALHSNDVVACWVLWFESKRESRTSFSNKSSILNQTILIYTVRLTELVSDRSFSDSIRVMQKPHKYCLSLSRTYTYFKIRNCKVKTETIKILYFYLRMFLVAISTAVFTGFNRVFTASLTAVIMNYFSWSEDFTTLKSLVHLTNNGLSSRFHDRQPDIVETYPE